MTGRRLEDLLVVSVEQAVAAPFATSRLADAGARVIKVERPEGDFGRNYDSVVQGDCAWFIWLNRGKESIALDFKQPEDAALLHAMIARADVFVQNLAPGAMARAGFDSAALRAHHPRLITCDISGYGEDGPYRDMKAYDFLVQCESGIVAMTGTPDAPARVGVSICDIGAGLNAQAAILEALLMRERTGRGDGIALSLFDGMADWMNVARLHHVYGGKAPGRTGLDHALIAPYGAYPVGDGSRIVIAIQNDREWRRFCDGVLKQPALGDDARFSNNSARIAHRPEMDAILKGCFAEHDAATLGELMNASGIAFGRLNEVADLAVHPQLRLATVEGPGGPAEIIAPPARHSSGDAALGAVPALDAQGSAIRREFAQTPKRSSP